MRKKKRQNIYVVLDDINFNWKASELETIIRLWNDGRSLWYIENEVNRNIDEIAILLMDLAETRRNFICERSRGLLTSILVDQPYQYQKRVENFLNEYINGYEALSHVNANFFWDEVEVHKFEQYWKEGISLERISRKLKRKPLDCMFLLLDRLRKGFIKGREGLLDGFEQVKICS